MISTYLFQTEKKVDYIVHEIIMGNRTEYEFNRKLVFSDNKGKLAFSLHNINITNYLEYSHYLVEMGYINVFHQDIKVGKKLRGWYIKQLKYVFKQSYIRLFYIMYERSKPMLKKYGESDDIDIIYFDAITDNYKKKKRRGRYFNNLPYIYQVLAQYAEIICKIIAAWQTVPAEERAAQTRLEFKTWLKNEKEFIENVYLNETSDEVEFYSNERSEYVQWKGKMIEAIDQTLPLL